MKALKKYDPNNFCIDDVLKDLKCKFKSMKKKSKKESKAKNSAVCDNPHIKNVKAAPVTVEVCV